MGERKEEINEMGLTANVEVFAMLVCDLRA